MSSPERPPIEILHLEDDPADAELSLESLRDAGLSFEEFRVESRAGFEAALLRGRASAQRPPFDLVVADYVVPGFGGDEALALARRLRPDLPFIVVSGKVGEELAVELLHAGANDYVLKQRIARLGFAVKRALREKALERERQLATEQLADLTARLQHTTLLERVVAQMPAGVLLARAPDGRVLAVNEYARSLFGLDRPIEMVADVARGHVYLPDGRRAGVDDLPTRRALQGELVRALVLEFRRPDGRSVFAQTSATPLRDAAGAVIGAIATYVDVTTSKEHEELLREQVEFREQLVAIVSHDLRSPLSAIRNSAHVLSRSVSAPGARRAVGAIERGAERMNALIGDLLDFAKTRLGGGLPLSRAPTDLSKLAESVLDEARLANPGRVLELTAAGRAVANVDPLRIQQALANLVANAITHGAPDRPVRVVVREVPGGAELEVRNEGAPIPPELLPALFEPFRRGNHPKGERNIGLGLYIVDQVVRAHGGRVDVHSSAEEGTRFTVRVPDQAARAEDAPAHH